MTHPTQSDAERLIAALEHNTAIVGAELIVSELRRLSAIEQERDQLRAQLAALKDGQAGGEVVGWLIDWPDEPDLGDYFAHEPSESGRSRPLVIATPKPMPMTDEQIRAIGKQFFPKTILTAAWFGFARAIEAPRGISEVQG